MSIRAKVLVAAVLVVVAVFAVDFIVFLTSTLPLEQQKILLIKPQTSFKKIASELEDQKLITGRYNIYFRIYARLTGKASRVKSGEYALVPELTNAQLLSLLVAGKTLAHHITFIDGHTFAQMQAKIDSRDEIKHTLKNKPPKDIMAALGEAGKQAEGWFLPNTYFYKRGATDLSIYKRAHQAMQKFMHKTWEGRADNIAVKSPYEMLILASIIEKETGQPSERARISGVFTRRLKKGMRLQTDPTVIYGMKKQGRITRKALLTDTPYNTYTRAGLPPTPIAMPSKAAIYAAVHPADGNALYFVSKGNGYHKFSATLQEHNRAVRKYILNQ